MKWMAQHGECPDCQGSLEVWRDYRGTSVRCKECGYEDTKEWACGGVKKKDKK